MSETTRREDAKPLLADLARQRAEHEKHLRNHPCDGARQALADVDRQEEQLYRWIAEEENAENAEAT